MDKEPESPLELPPVETPSDRRPKDYAFGIAGALIGAVAGYFSFGLILKSGLYAIVLPGAMVGWGCGMLSGRLSKDLGIICGVIALLLGLFIEWQFFPFRKDNSLPYFLTHIHQVRIISLIMILLGAWLGYHFGLGRPGGYGFRRT